MAMAEMYGMDPDPELEDALRKAVDLLIRCQSDKGGWRYQPKKSDEDLSVTVMQIVALRAANNAEIPVPEPGEGEVLVRVEATPINPSDMGLLFGPADMTTARASGSPERPVVSADVPERLLKTVSARLDQALPCGNEGAGIVVKAGASDARIWPPTV